MKYTDYYAALGVERGASAEDIKKAYRRLAQKYHPDVSKEPGAEARFKEIGEAWQTLKDPEKRAAYDELGSQPQGGDFRPPPDWARQHGGEGFQFENMDFADLFARFGGRGARGEGFTGRAAEGSSTRFRAAPGQDFDVPVQISLEDAFQGTTLSLNLSLPEYDAQGGVRRVPHTVKARIAPGAVDGQRLRLPGKGGKGFNGGRDGDLYLDITLKPHRFFRVTGHDLYLDVPLAPWEAALGATVEVPTLAGAVNLKVPAGASSGQKLRLGGRGLPMARGGAGDLFAVLQVVVPPADDRERKLYEELAKGSNFNPRTWGEGG
jgi:curved DNA-binding protein